MAKILSLPANHYIQNIYIYISVTLKRYSTSKPLNLRKPDFLGYIPLGDSLYALMYLLKFMFLLVRTF